MTIRLIGATAGHGPGVWEGCDDLQGPGLGAGRGLHGHGGAGDGHVPAHRSGPGPGRQADRHGRRHWIRHDTTARGRRGLRPEDYALTVNEDRARHRAELPELRRRDVRLLGDILGEVIRDSDSKTGPDLLADVERLRHAVIEARDQERRDADPAGDAIAALVASWDLDRAEQVARAFTVYFHLANLAEEHQRIRLLRERDAGNEPVRESLAAAVTELSRDGVPVNIDDLRVHLVLTAHPTEARRRAVVAGLRRVNELLNVVDDERAGAGERAAAPRALAQHVDPLG